MIVSTMNRTKATGWPQREEDVVRSYLGDNAIGILTSFGTRVVVVPEDSTYGEVSPYTRSNPFERDELVRGTYVVCERAVYVRNRSDGTLIHEMVHALLDALDVTIRTDAQAVTDYYEACTKGTLVSDYSHHSLPEWHAECIRAWCNAPNGIGDDATRERLLEVDPIGYKVAEVFMQRITSSTPQLTL